MKNDELKQQSFKRQYFKSQEFSSQDVDLLKLYCDKLAYHITFNPINKTAKIWDIATRRYGFIKKCGTNFIFGHIKPDSEGNAQFTPKYSLTSNFQAFAMLNNINMFPARKDVLKHLCGIIEFNYYL